MPDENEGQTKEEHEVEISKRSNKPLFQPVRATRIEITTKLLEEFIASLRRGEFVIRSIEIPQQGAPLKAEVSVFTSIRGTVNVSGSLTFEKFNVKEVEGQIMLMLPGEESHVSKLDRNAEERIEVFGMLKSICRSIRERDAACAQFFSEHDERPTTDKEMLTEIQAWVNKMVPLK